MCLQLCWRAALGLRAGRTARWAAVPGCGWSCAWTPTALSGPRGDVPSHPVLCWAVPPGVQAGEAACPPSRSEPSGRVKTRSEDETPKHSPSAPVLGPLLPPSHRPAKAHSGWSHSAGHPRATRGLATLLLPQTSRNYVQGALCPIQFSPLIRHFQVLEIILKFLGNQIDSSDQSCLARWEVSAPVLGSRALGRMS